MSGPLRTVSGRKTWPQCLSCMATPGEPVSGYYSETVPLIGEADLRKLVQRCTELVPDGTSDLRLLRHYALAAGVIATLGDPQWMPRRMSDPSDANFFNVPGDTGASHRHIDRVVMLGEMLYNLQTVEGFAGRLKALMSDKRSIEACVGELEGARMLHRAEIPFRFVDPQGSLGQDYDVEVLVDPRPIHCEMKCKIEGTDLGPRTIFNSLDAARRQLPPEAPGIIFVKLPHSWPTHPTLPLNVEVAVSKHFRQASRIGAVVFHWEEWIGDPAQQARRANRLMKWTHRRNFASPFAQLVHDRCIAPIVAADLGGRWVRLIDAVDSIDLTGPS